MPRPRRVVRPYEVFVSHATDDKFIARTVCEKVEALGAATFRDDRDIQGGDDIPRTIVRRLRAARELLILLTPVSVKREWVILELGIALGAGKRVVPIRYQLRPEEIPAVLRAAKAHDLNDLDDYLGELRTRLAE